MRQSQIWLGWVSRVYTPVLRSCHWRPQFQQVYATGLYSSGFMVRFISVPLCSHFVSLLWGTSDRRPGLCTQMTSLSDSSPTIATRYRSSWYAVSVAVPYLVAVAYSSNSILSIASCRLIKPMFSIWAIVVFIPVDTADGARRWPSRLGLSGESARADTLASCRSSLDVGRSWVLNIGPA